MRLNFVTAPAQRTRRGPVRCHDGIGARGTRRDADDGGVDARRSWRPTRDGRYKDLGDIEALGEDPTGAG